MENKGEKGLAILYPKRDSKETISSSEKKNLPSCSFGTAFFTSTLLPLSVWRLITGNLKKIYTKHYYLLKEGIKETEEI